MRIITIFAVTTIITILLVMTRPDTQAELQPLPSPLVAVDAAGTRDVQPVTRIVGRLRTARMAHLGQAIPGCNLQPLYIIGILALSGIVVNDS